MSTAGGLIDLLQLLSVSRWCFSLSLFNVVADQKEELETNVRYGSFK